MSTFDTLKSVASTLQEAGKIEQYKLILETQKELLEMQKKISDLELNNKSLIDKLKIKNSLIYENNSYWIKQDSNTDGPFCSCCWDDKNKTIRMQPCNNPAYYDCPKCQNKSILIYPEKDPREYSKPNPPISYI
jgi:hypothetical protein